jgi:hypothetical protein
MEMLRAERAENVRLTNIILQHLGVSIAEGDTTVHVKNDDLGKVRIAQESWPAYRARLEKRYRARIEEVEPEVLDFDNKAGKENAETN